MTEQPTPKKTFRMEGATKKTSFGPNRTGKSRSRIRGSDLIILAAGIVVFVSVAGFIAGNEMKKRQASSNQAAVRTQGLSEAGSSQGKDAAASSPSGRIPADSASAGESSDSAEACAGCMSEPQMLLTSRPDESVLRLPVVEEVRGRWVARMQDATAEAFFDQAGFQIIYAGRHESGIRRYVRGYYAFDEATGVMSLKPAHKESEPEPVPDVVYQVLTLRYFDVAVRTDSGAHIQYWTVPPEMLASRQIFPLLAFTGIEDNPYLVWEKVQ